MLYFCQDIFPSIRNSVPNGKLTLVGNAPSDAIKRLAGEAIEVTGYVPDTTPYLESSAISVAPCASAPGSNDIWSGVASRDARLTGKHAGFDRAG
jgi:hypothetical protein